METWMCEPLHVIHERRLEPYASHVDAWSVLGEPTFLTLQRIGHAPRPPGLRNPAEELQRLEKLDASALRRAFDWARRAKPEQRFSRLSMDELAAIRLCLEASHAGETPPAALLAHLQDETWFSAMNRFLASRHPANTESMSAAIKGTAAAWEVVVADVVSGLTALRLRDQREADEDCHCYRIVWIPQQTFDALFGANAAAGYEDGSHLLCFPCLQRVGSSEPWQSVAQLRQGCVPCLLEFDAAIARRAADVRDFLGDGGLDGNSPELLLPPFLRGSVRGIRRDRAPAPYHLDIFRIQIAGLTEVEFSDEILEAPAEAVLGASMLLALQSEPAKDSEASPLPPEELAAPTPSPDLQDASPKDEPETSSTPSTRPSGGQADPPPLSPTAAQAAVDLASEIFAQLAVSLRARSPKEAGTVWKGYLECALDGKNLWKELGNTLQLGPIGMARTAAMGSARASLRVTKRVLGFQSCVNYEAMDAQFHREVEELEARRHSAVACARVQVSALQLETLSDPEAFLRFLAHDPVGALRATPAILKVYRHSAGPAQRVLLFAKLVGLSAMAGGLLRGDPRVCEAFEGLGPPGSPWQCFTSYMDQLEAGGLRPSDAGEGPAAQAEAGHRALALLTLQRLHLARVQLLVTAGAPDTGKTTFFREVFGLSHLRAGLSEEGRTDEVLFELHPSGDPRFRPVYLVDTPGIGDGAQLHRNDMCRLLLHGSRSLASNVQLVWVLRAGRHTRDEAQQFVLSMLQATSRPVLVLVTHVDKLFEERYREAGPHWRDGILHGVHPKDPRWQNQRRVLMQELQEEIQATIRSSLQLEEAGDLKIEVHFACLAGWMARGDDEEEDEFAETAPWPWARAELTAFFGVLSRTELRKLLDSRLGLA